MANIKKTEKTADYIKLVERQKTLGEKNDCSVKAIALACGVHYDVAHAAMAAEGRVNGKGSYRAAILRALDACGREHQEVCICSMIEKYPRPHREVLKNVTTHHPARFNSVWKNGQVYLMFTSNHVLTIIDGVNHDFTINKAARAIALYRVF